MLSVPDLRLLHRMLLSRQGQLGNSHTLHDKWETEAQHPGKLYFQGDKTTFVWQPLQITNHMFKVLQPPRGGAFDQCKSRNTPAQLGTQPGCTPHPHFISMLLLGRRGGIFSLFEIPLFFLFSFPLCPRGTEWQHRSCDSVSVQIYNFYILSLSHFIGLYLIQNAFPINQTGYLKDFFFHPHGPLLLTVLCDSSLFGILYISLLRPTSKLFL